QIQQIGFFRAFSAILAGTCIASFTPNRVGEYLGRMLYVDQGNKLLSVAPTILCSFAQMLVTLTAGAVGLYLFSYLPLHFDVDWLTAGVFRTGVAAIGLGLVYFRFDPLVNRINRWLKKNQKNFSIPQDYSFKKLATILL